MSTHFYNLYGFSVASEIALPYLLPSIGGEPDVHIVYGDVPRSLTDPTTASTYWQVAQREFLFDMAGVAGYLVRNGQHIRVAPYPDATEDDIRVYLMGTVLAVLLQQRGFFVLHASTIETSSGAVLFTGHSGLGKSTLLAAMLQRGYAMLTDDKAAMILDDSGNPLTVPGFPANRLWSETVNKLVYPQDNLTRLRPSLDKYVLPVRNFCSKQLKVRAIYQLLSHDRDEISLIPLTGIECFQAIVHNIFEPYIAHALKLGPHNFKVTEALIARARVVRVTRPNHNFQLDELVAHIEEDLL